MTSPPDFARQRTVMIHPQAPEHPGFGRPCNGCGLCCLAEPCPLGMVVSRSRTGACKALLWADDVTIYRCGLLARPKTFIPWLPARLVRALASRWIAAGAGCDAHLERVQTGG
jgi:hypothetical protein